jgi:hypothetical protein
VPLEEGRLVAAVASEDDLVALIGAVEEEPEGSDILTVSAVISKTLSH